MEVPTLPQQHVKTRKASSLGLDQTLCLQLSHRAGRRKAGYGEAEKEPRTVISQGGSSYCRLVSVVSASAPMAKCLNPPALHNPDGVPPF